MPVGLRSRVPAKITSSMREPRRVLADCSPSTQEIASAIFDLPQPLGPMMAAMPSPWNLRSVRSQKDLKPRICSRFSLSNVNSLDAQWPEAGCQWPVVRLCCLPACLPERYLQRRNDACSDQVPSPAGSGEHKLELL